MKTKRIARIIGLIFSGLLCGFGSVSAFVDGRSMAGRFGGFRFIQKEEEPVLFSITAGGGMIVAAVLLFIAWKEIRAVAASGHGRGPIQSPQHNADSRPSSGDSSASETPSSRGPRG